MNSVERLWRALVKRDWDAIRPPLHPHATIELPHIGERLDVEAYIARCRAERDDWTMHVHAIVSGSEDLPVAVHARATGTHGRYECGAFYSVHQGRIAHGVELWVPDALPEQRAESGRHRH